MANWNRLRYNKTLSHMRQSFVGANLKGWAPVRWLSQESVAQTAVHRDDVAGGLAQAIGDEEKERLGLVGRSDGALGQCPVSVEFGETRRECLGRFTLGVRDAVFGEAGQDTFAREHRAALHDRRRRDTSHANQRSEVYGEFAD